MESEQKNNKEQKTYKLKIHCKNCSQKLDVTELPPFSVIACPICNADIVVPLQFENYLLDRLEGVGGTAKVYRGTDIALNRTVAVKIMSDKTLTDSEAVKHFLQEAQTAATLTHPAIIPVYTCGVAQEKPFIVMQYMSGGSLETALIQKKGKLPLREVIRWMIQIADGLEYAYHAGIVHHDVKPANIMLDQDNNAKIGDFGLAQITKGTAVSKENNCWVSPEYVSPEKVQTGKEDYKGDIFSFGVTLYQLLTNKIPFSGTTPEDMMNMRLTQIPEAPCKINKNIPQPLSNLIMSMLAMDPANRPEYQEIITVLSTQLRSETIRSQKEKLWKSQLWYIPGVTAAALILILIGNLLPKFSFTRVPKFSPELKSAIETGINFIDIAYQEAENSKNPHEIRVRAAMLAVFADYKENGPQAEKRMKKVLLTFNENNPKEQFPIVKKITLSYLFSTWGKADFCIGKLGYSQEEAAEALLAIILKIQNGQEGKSSLNWVQKNFRKNQKGTWLEILPPEFEE